MERVMEHHYNLQHLSDPIRTPISHLFTPLECLSTTSKLITTHGKLNMIVSVGGVKVFG